MSDRQDLNPNPRSKCASNIEKNDPRRSRLQLTRSGILCVHNRVHPDPKFARLHEVSDPGVRDLLRRGEACQRGGERNGEKQLSHLSLQGFRCAP
jgi:hypothetical protein